MQINREDVEWVISFGQYNQRQEKKISPTPQVGVVNGLAVFGANIGTVIEVEVAAVPSTMGRLAVTGIIDEEEISVPGKVMRRKSIAKGYLDNVLTVLANYCGIDYHKYDMICM